MGNMKLIVSALLVFSFVGIGETFPQRRPNGKQGTAKSRPSPTTKQDVAPEKKDVSVTDRYLGEAFDPQIERLPENFLGHDLERIFAAAAERLQLKKDEFESTSDFTERLNKLNEKPLYGNVQANSTLAFVLSPEYTVLQSTYDADSMTMRAIQPVGEVRKSPGENLSLMKSLPWKKTTSESTYKANNAFGAETVVSKSQVLTYDIAFSIFNWTWASSVKSIVPNFGDYIFEDSFKVEKSIAKETKENLRYLVIGRFASPSILTGINSVKPTFSSPKEVFEAALYVNLDILELWVFNSKTGEVYIKRKPQNQ
jgi:hypothetical protein